jgi:hypothetical protein
LEDTQHPTYVESILSFGSYGRGVIRTITPGIESVHTIAVEWLTDPRHVKSTAIFLSVDMLECAEEEGKESTEEIHCFDWGLLLGSI